MCVKHHREIACTSCFNGHLFDRVNGAKRFVAQSGVRRPLATYFTNKRPFRKPAAAIPVGRLAAVNAAGAEFQRRKSTNSVQLFFKLAKNEIACTTMTTAPLHRLWSFFETQYIVEHTFPSSGSSYIQPARGYATKKSRE